MALQLSSTKSGCSPHSSPSSCSRRVGWMTLLSLGRYFRAPGQFCTPFARSKKEQQRGVGVPRDMLQGAGNAATDSHVWFFKKTMVNQRGVAGMN